MTDREKLIELLGGDMCKGCYCEDCEHENNEEACIEHIKSRMAGHLIANGVTFAPDNNVGRWIPVTERLPEDDLPKGSKVKQLKVLVAYKTNGRWIVRTVIRAKGYWHSRDNWDWIKMSDPITHWMPLPEPPKEV